MQIVRLARSGAIAALVAAAVPVGAQNVVDQQQTTSAGAFGGISAWNAQTFAPGASNVSGGGFLLQNGGAGSGSATIGLWSDNPALGGQMLASGSGTFALGTAAGAAGWFDVFWAPVPVTVGQTYWLVIGGGPQGVVTSNASASSYAAGGAWYNYGANVNAAYSDFSAGYDLAFRTYADVTPVGAPSVTTPEPASLALLGTGLAGLAVVARRRRRA